MLLLTGATGLVGSRLLRRLTARGEPVRCLVRDPRRLGPERVRVQIAIGDLADPRVLPPRAARRAHRRPPRRLAPRPAARHDRGARRARHLAPAARRRARRGRATSCSSPRSAPRRTTAAALHRAKALAEQAVAAADLRTTTLRAARSSTRPATAGCARLDRLACCPAVPLAGRGRRAHAADLGRGRRRLRDRRARRARRAARALRARRPRRAHPPRGRRARAARRAAAAAGWCPSRSPLLRAAAARLRGAGRARRRWPPGTRRELLGVHDAHAARDGRRRGARRPPAPAARRCSAPRRAAGGGAVPERPRRLELRGDLQQRVLAERLADELRRWWAGRRRRSRPAPRSPAGR